MNKYRVSETFVSIQGEGRYTGQLTAWVRFFACNLQCRGFSQKDPADPITYIDDFKDVDVSKYKSLNEIPIITHGCDSAYSWAAKFKHLCPELTADEIVQQLENQMPFGSFITTRQARNPIHLAFTGGEPLLKRHQDGIIDILETMALYGETAGNVTIETNGTQMLDYEFIKWVSQNMRPKIEHELFFSVSPKLYTVSGELTKDAIFPLEVAQYNHLSEAGQLKFVLANEKRCWDELEDTIMKFRNAGVEYPVWIMPVGSSKEQQEQDDVRQIAEEAMKRGYNVSARVHSLIFGNGIGR